VSERKHLLKPRPLLERKPKSFNRNVSERKQLLKPLLLT